MVVLRSSWKLCLNDQVVPLERKVCGSVDPYELMTNMDLDLEELEVSLVNFKGTADIAWLEKALEKPARWWVHNHNNIALLQEIKDLIKAKKPKANQGPKNHKSLVALQVRGRVLYVINNPNAVTLALVGHAGAPPDSPEDQSGTLLWFVDEVQKDLENLSSEPQEKRQKASQSSGSQEQDEWVNQGIERLLENPHCASAHFRPSRRSFAVVRKGDKALKELRVGGLHKKTTRSPEENFEQVVSSLLSFLDSKDDPEADLDTEGP